MGRTQGPLPLQCNGQSLWDKHVCCEAGDSRAPTIDSHNFQCRKQSGGLPRRIYRQEASHGLVVEMISGSPDISAGAPGKVVLLPSTNKRGNSFQQRQPGWLRQALPASAMAQGCRATLIDSIMRCNAGVRGKICAAR